jgi:hypothetical protein
MGDLEQHQAAGLETLRAQIAQFIAENEGRLVRTETSASFDPQDMIDQFADLRRRTEERIAAVEQRSVRMLEQVAETVLLLDKRLSGASPEPAMKSA